MSSKTGKSPNAFRTISEVADSLGMPQHVLRFWESKFSQISPMKRGGGRRYYRPEDVETIEAIRKLLHEDGYTIKGAQKFLKENGLQKTPLISSDTGKKETADNAVNAYETQILNITRKSIKSLENEANAVDILKNLRNRLSKIHSELKSLQNL